MKSTGHEFQINGTDMLDATAAGRPDDATNPALAPHASQVLDCGLAVVQATGQASASRLEAYRQVFPGFSRPVPLRVSKGRRES